MKVESPIPAPEGWRILPLHAFIRTNDRCLDLFEHGWQATEFTTKHRIRVGSVLRSDGEKPRPYIRRIK